MSQENDENGNSKSAKVLKLGFNISVTGDPDADFEIELDDKSNENFPSLKCESHCPELIHLQDDPIDVPKRMVELKQLKSSKSESTGAKGTTANQHSLSKEIRQASMSDHNTTDNPESSGFKDLSLINDIKNTMEHFEKFSDHIREIPRFKIGPVASSTPFSRKENSKSESNLIYPERRPRRYSHLYDFNSRRDYFRGKAMPSDLFLRPLPGADLYKRGMVRSYGYDPFIYGSVDSLSKSGCKYSSSAWKSTIPDEQCTSDVVPSEVPSGILRRSDNDSGEKSASSAESVKDIKIYQNGGILIMQNFKDSSENVAGKREISDFSAKLIENCNRLKEEINSMYPLSKPAIGNSSGESQNSGKMVQFDLFESDYQKNKYNFLDTSFTSKEESPSKPELLDFSGRDSLLENQACQDFLSMSTQENDSIVSNAPGMSPNASAKKLEWDSGADVGYLNLDLSKENLSTIERIVLRGLSSEGLQKNVVYEKKLEEPYYDSTKVVLERKPSEVIIEEIVEVRNAWEIEKSKGSDATTSDHVLPSKNNSENEKKGADRREIRKKHKSEKIVKDVAKFEPSKLNKLPFQNVKHSAHKVQRGNSRDKSVKGDTLSSENSVEPPLAKDDSCELALASPNVKTPRTPPRYKKVKKKLGSPKAQISHVPSTTKTDFVPSKMGIPKKSYKKLEAKPELSDLERSREIEEIVVDQSLKVRDPGGAEKLPVETVPEANEGAGGKMTESSRRPVSGSSTKTVLSNQKKKDFKRKSDKSLLRDQIIQTSECKVESIGIQAFSSQKSSVCNSSSSRRTQAEISVSSKTAINEKHSKNIQAFGLNSSLPKELGHPKESNVLDSYNAKSTQFFGGPINSLPNYHSHATNHPPESCGRMLKILKAKKNLESERIDLKEENKKNIMANDQSKKVIDDGKNLNQDVGTPDNKENVRTTKPLIFGNNEDYSSKKNQKARDEESTKVEGVDSSTRESRRSRKEPKDGLVSSDSAPRKMLTSKHLKEHGDSIDRNLIQEMYFNQLAEMEKREMISKSTSMNFPFEVKDGSLVPEKATVGCQYSSRSKSGSEEAANETGEIFKGEEKISQETTDLEHQTTDQGDGVPREADEKHKKTSKSTNNDFGTGDSFPSSTQTANSWVHGMPNTSGNNESVVGRARSFEYLPGDVYESSGNLREKLPSENGENVITGSSLDSSIDGDSRKGSKGTGSDGGSSEGRKTLVLENSNEPSWDSGQLKSLDENLTQLNIVVTRLREKDDEIRKITRSVLVNLWRHNGSGDGIDYLDTNTPDTKINDRKIEQSGKKGSCDVLDLTDEEPRLVTKLGQALDQKETNKIDRDRDVSIACQTEPEPAESNLEHYQKERKSLETRLAADKESQIKWIEKEIYHLNILRGILEKQGSLGNRKKKLSSSTLPSDADQSEKNLQLEDTCAEVHSRPVTPVYGCTISVLQNDNGEGNGSLPERENTIGDSGVSNKVPSTLDDTKYGLAVSLNGNLRKVMLLPVGVQVSWNKSDFNGNCSNNDTSDQENHSKRQQLRSRPDSRSQGIDKSHLRPCKQYQSDVTTQYPSAKKSHIGNPSASVQANISTPNDCGYCNQKSCVCISLSQSENSDAFTDGYSRSDRTTTGRQSKSSKQVLENSIPINHSAGQKSMSNSTGTDTMNTESLLETGQRCGEKSKERSLNSTTSNSRGKGSACKCESCPRRNTSSKDRALNPRDQTNTCHNQKNSPDDSSNGLCRCLKAQAAKSSACHVIKIVGPSCCAPDSGTCSCKKRNIKKTENQSCQTDDIVIESKDLVTNSELVKPNKNSEVVCPVERKVAIERRHSVDEKYLCAPKVSYDKRHTHLAKIGLEEKCAVQKKAPESEASTEAKTVLPTCTCDCKKKKEKEKQKVDDHPRHYFLKIEEKEMDESCESIDRPKSLEVITVTVPVKKAGKAKIYGSNIKQAITSDSNTMQYLPSQEKTGCTCCKDCFDQKSKVRPSQECESREMNKCQKVPAERPHSYRKTNKNYQKAIECESVDDIEPCTEELSFNERYNPSSSSQEEYNDRRFEYPTPGPCRGRQETRDDTLADCYSRNNAKSCSRETPSDYDSHKEYKPQHSRFFGNERDNGRKSPLVGRYVAEEPFEESAGTRNYKPQKYFLDPNRYDSDYYNYNKREFMTKSEILQEEQKKKKKHQPSLQEYLESNRPDFCSSAESRRRIISERAKERVKNHGNRMECLLNLMHQCGSRNEEQKKPEGSKRIFTTPQMREQTMKRYRQLPEVTEKVADQKKKEEYRTNKLMADIFAKKLQIEALKGHINLSNSVSVLSTI